MPSGQQTLKGHKNDVGKPQISLVTRSLIVGIATIMGVGLKKYGRDNWKKGMLWSRPYDALQRHLLAWWAGEGIDEESGESHLWHAACELMFLIEYEQNKLGKDDRYGRG